MFCRANSLQCQPVSARVRLLVCSRSQAALPYTSRVQPRQLQKPASLNSVDQEEKRFCAKMASESLRTATPADNDTSPRRSPSPASLQLLPSGQEMSEILQQMCGEISQTTTSEIVEVANSAASRSKLQELLPVYFYSWQLQNLEAVIINLLLNYFVLWRDGSDMRRDRQAFEEHIARLKNRVAELEENREPDQEINKLMKKAQDLVLQNERLQKAHDELCHINDQWAQDYESLTQKMTANSTGCYSIPSSIASHQHISICTQCPQLERKLDESQNELRQLTAKLDTLQKTIDQRNRQVEHLENENRAIQFQLQEIGDLPTAMKIKQDYSKLQIQMAQLKKQYQDAVCQRLQLNKQVEKLRHTFLQLFPFGRSATTFSAKRRGNSTLAPCRMQQYYSDPGPPTPPGLIARGDHFGSLVEKDLEPPKIHIDEQVTGFEGSVRRLDDFHTWHGATSANELHMQLAAKKPRPRSLFQPTTSATASKPSSNVVCLDFLECRSCSKMYPFNLEGFERWFDHVRFCGVL